MDYHLDSPDQSRIYAIGDIHGRLDCLQALHEVIRDHVRTFPVDHVTLVYLGDYIDRGPDSRGVIEYLLNNSLGNRQIYLMGNHEYYLNLVVEGRLPIGTWLKWGGDSTLRSYNIEPMSNEQGQDDRLISELISEMPVPHRRFLKRLHPFYHSGDYIFVHAGMRAGVALEKQTLLDMITIREGFLDHPVDMEHTIVYGHTIHRKPLAEEKRIGIDTGAYKTGILTAGVFGNRHVSFLSTREYETLQTYGFDQGKLTGEAD